MKKACAAAGLGAILAFSSLAGATPIWTNTVGESGSATHTFNNGQPNFSYIFDITNINHNQDGTNAFLPGTDMITSGELILYFKNSDARDVAEIRLGDYTTTITDTEETRIQLPADALNQLNTTGVLAMNINATQVNSFRLENLILNASGVDNTPFTNGNGGISPTGNDTAPAPAPVPEPSTFILLGACLAGMAFWRKRSAS